MWLNSKERIDSGRVREREEYGQKEEDEEGRGVGDSSGDGGVVGSFPPFQISDVMEMLIAAIHRELYQCHSDKCHNLGSGPLSL